MRRADRLFHIVQLLRGRPRVTGAELSHQLQVSVRTVYRDIEDLRASGVPIVGETGVGFALQRGYELPPMTFESAELQALLLGARMVRRFADAELGEAADRVLAKIEAVLPAMLRERLWADLYVPGRLDQEDDALSGGRSTVPGADQRLTHLRRAIAEKHLIHLCYTRKDGATSDRVVSPVGLFFWGRVWSLGAWCALRGGWRNFRVDRITSVTLLGETLDPAHTLDAYTAAMAAQGRRER